MIIVIKQGPERVAFHPKVARIQRANQQIATMLGHSIQIELDGALLPQTHDESEDVIARLVEAVAMDLGTLAKDKSSGALAYARDHFEKLTVRYAPTEAAAREVATETGWRQPRGGRSSKLDIDAKSIDITRSEARWLTLDRGDVSTVLYRAYAAKQDDRYGFVLPDAIPANERRTWFEYHAHGSQGIKTKNRLGSVDTLCVVGMVSLARGSDEALAKDARAYLINHVLEDFAQTYHHHQAEVVAAPQGSPFRQAETELVSFLRAEIPKMQGEERGKVASRLWVYDFKKSDSGSRTEARDRFATYAFPGIDPMQFAFDTVDSWIAAGHPIKYGAGNDDPFEIVVAPVAVELKNGGRPNYRHAGRSEAHFYEWALGTREREDAFVRGLNQRANDPPFAMTAFYNAHRSLHEENEYLRFLRRFEGSPVLWSAGADIHREVVYRPSPGLLEESRRLWREVPHARPYVFLWFSRHVEASYHPEVDFPDLVQGTPADDVVLDKFLALGWETFEILPVAWMGVAKTNGRIRVMTKHANILFGQDIQAKPGGHNVAGTMAAVARILCEDKMTAEVAELRSYAQAELPKRPGAGLSDVIEATDPANCKPRKGATPTPAAAQKKPFAKGQRQ